MDLKNIYFQFLDTLLGYDALIQRQIKRIGWYYYYFFLHKCQGPLQMHNLYYQLFKYVLFFFLFIYIYFFIYNMTNYS